MAGDERADRTDNRKGDGDSTIPQGNRNLDGLISGNHEDAGILDDHRDEHQRRGNRRPNQGDADHGKDDRRDWKATQ